MPKRIFEVTLKIIGAITLVVTYYFLNTHYNFYIPCPIYSITKLYCPGCGITRCLFALLKLDFSSAFRYNQLVFILIPFFLFYFSYKTYLYILDKEDKILSRIPKTFWLILLIITISFGILRNIEAFSIIRPQ